MACSSEDFISCDKSGIADLLRLLQTISILFGVFQFSPTEFFQVSKYKSQFPVAPIPKASRYHRSFPSYCWASVVQMLAASLVELPRMARATSLRTCGDGSFMRFFATVIISVCKNLM